MVGAIFLVMRMASADTYTTAKKKNSVCQCITFQVLGSKEIPVFFNLLTIASVRVCQKSSFQCL